MDSPTAFVAALIVLPAVALVAWAWYALVRLDDDLHASGESGAFEGSHFDIGPRAIESNEGPKWAIPG